MYGGARRHSVLSRGGADVDMSMLSDLGEVTLCRGDLPIPLAERVVSLSMLRKHYSLLRHALMCSPHACPRSIPR